MSALEIPLSSCADRWVSQLASSTGSSVLSRIRGSTLLGERAHLAGFLIPKRISAGGGCRLFNCLDDEIALNLARSDDRELLPALFASDTVDPSDATSIAAHMSAVTAADVVARGRSMGLAIAAVNERARHPSAPNERLAEGRSVERHARRRPRVIDLSALWAGPLASHLMQLAGAEVIKVESRLRPDGMRRGEDAFYNLLNQDKASVALDFTASGDRAALLSLIESADIVIEASRPRALEQLGIDANRLVATTPGLTWITITAHGAQGDAAQHVGFGDDCAVAGGLSRALRDACGESGFVGDAIADPLTGIYAALTAWESWAGRRGGRIGIAMSHVVASCIETARAANSDAFDASLRAWRAAVEQPFPTVEARHIGKAAGFGEHTRSVLAQVQQC